MEEFVENDSTKEVKSEESAETSQGEQQDAGMGMESLDEKTDDTRAWKK